MNWSVYIDECNEENQNKYEQVDELIVDMFLMMMYQPHNNENDFYRNIREKWDQNKNRQNIKILLTATKENGGF